MKTSDPAILWTAISSNLKTGPIPVSTQAKSTCGDCALKGNGCYAEQGGMGAMWSAMSAAGPLASFKNGRGTLSTTDWRGMTQKVAALEAGQLWRFGQAGDLPHEGGEIDRPMAMELAHANAGKPVIAYTHHELSAANLGTLREMASVGMTVNLSANTLAEADLKAATGLPVVVLLAHDHGSASTVTPEGRKVAVCPATYREGTRCVDCGLCAKAERKVIVGFPGHGGMKKRVSALAGAA